MSEPWNKQLPEIETAFRICAQGQEHEALRRLPLDKMPQNIQGVVRELRILMFAAAADATNALSVADGVITGLRQTVDRLGAKCDRLEMAVRDAIACCETEPAREEYEAMYLHLKKAIMGTKQSLVLMKCRFCGKEIKSGTLVSDGSTATSDATRFGVCFPACDDASEDGPEDLLRVAQSQRDTAEKQVAVLVGKASELRQLAVDALNEIRPLRAQVLSTTPWTKKIDALFDRAIETGIRRE